MKAFELTMYQLHMVSGLISTNAIVAIGQVN